MKVVLTVRENRISPVADSAGQLLVVDIENRTIRGKSNECLDGESVFNYARRLADLEVEIFICGAISNFFAGLVEGYGIRLIPFICIDAKPAGPYRSIWWAWEMMKELSVKRAAHPA